MTDVKEQAINLIKDLPENVTWNDIMYKLYVREKIEKAIEEADKGNLIPHEEVKKRLLSK
jgi:predicted transcriptional regulator